MKITKSNLPESSLLENTPHAYMDSYSATFNAKGLTIEQVSKSFFQSNPAWVGWLFALRNRIVSLFGLKTSGSGEQEAVVRDFKCEIGDRVDLFKVFDKTSAKLF